MDFGKLPNIEGVDFALPPDHPDTSRVLGGAAHPNPVAYVGCPVWATREWMGKWYPANATEKDFLYHYARQFNSIELNTTHYRIPDEATIARWRSAVPDGFAFCPKWPQQISHDAGLIGVESATRAFGEAISGLGDKLGVSFLQLAPTFSPRHAHVLRQFVEKLTLRVPLAVELRHADWFKPSAEVDDTFAMLAANGVGMVMSDVAGRRDVLHMRLTTPVAVVRFVGNSLHPTDYRRVDDWIRRIEAWLAKGLQTVYFFVHQPDPNTLAPETCRYVAQSLNRHCGFNIQVPRPLPQVVQGSLF